MKAKENSKRFCGNFAKKKKKCCSPHSKPASATCSSANQAYNGPSACTLCQNRSGPTAIGNRAVELARSRG